MAAERGGTPLRAGELVSALFGGAQALQMSAAQRAAREWYAANGDRERVHTTGVWLRKSGRDGQDPVLVVALDSGLLAQELGTNKDLYLQRLAFRGLRVSDIRFQVRARTGQAPAPAVRKDRAKRAKSAPVPTPQQEARAERACAGLPDGLRQSVSRAMCASLARNSTHDT